MYHSEVNSEWRYRSLSQLLPLPVLLKTCIDYLWSSQPQMSQPPLFNLLKCCNQYPSKTSFKKCAFKFKNWDKRDAFGKLHFFFFFFLISTLMIEPLVWLIRPCQVAKPYYWCIMLSLCCLWVMLSPFKEGVSDIALSWKICSRRGFQTMLTWYLSFNQY